MDRKEFLETFGVGAFALVGYSCLGGCKLEDQTTGPTAPTGVDFTLDLTAPANAALKSDGGALVANAIIIVRKNSTTYVALSAACTHQGTTVQYQPSTGGFHCDNHGSDFSSDGSVVNGPARVALTRYNVSLDGTALRIFS